MPNLQVATLPAALQSELLRLLVEDFYPYCYNASISDMTEFDCPEIHIRHIYEVVEYDAYAGRDFDETDSLYWGYSLYIAEYNHRRFYLVERFSYDAGMRYEYVSDTIETYVERAENMLRGLQLFNDIGQIRANWSANWSVFGLRSITHAVQEFEQNGG